MKKDEERALNILQNTSFFTEGKYGTRFLWRDDKANLCNKRELAVQKLHSWTACCNKSHRENVP